MKYCTYTESGMNSESQKKTLVFPKHARAGVFFWGGGLEQTEVDFSVPTSCHANESSPSVLNRPFFVT